MTAAGQKAASRKRMSQQHMDAVRRGNRVRRFFQGRNLTEDQREEVRRTDRESRFSQRINLTEDQRE